MNENSFRMCFVNASISFAHLWSNLVAPCPSILTSILLFSFSLLCVTTPEFNWYWFASHQVSIICMVILLMCIFMWITQMKKKGKTSNKLKNIDYYKKSSQIMNINDRFFFINNCQIHVWLVLNWEPSLHTMYIHFTCMRRIPPCAGDIDVNVY